MYRQTTARTAARRWIEGEGMIDISAPDDRVCNDCINYDISECVCMLDWTMQHPCTPACEAFEEDER